MHFTKKEYEELISSYFVIVCQTNEQKNAHILKYFDENGIKHISRSIPEGDYAFMIKACPHLGFAKDTYFFDEAFIERKNSLQELAQSIYGAKDIPPYVDAVISRLKGNTDLSSDKLTRIIKDTKKEFCVYDDAFSRELKRAINKPNKYLLVEQQSGWDGILKHDYPNQYNEKAFWAALHIMEQKYDLKVKFIPANRMGLEIYTICKTILDSLIIK